MDSFDDDDAFTIALLLVWFQCSNFLLTLLLHESTTETSKGDGPTRKRKKPRRPDYWASAWGEMIKEMPSHMKEDPDGRQHKQFRLRFRLPFPMFTWLVDWTRTWYDLKKKIVDVTGLQRIPIELLVLGVLRMLGRGTCLDGIYELSFVSKTTMQAFFHDWCSHVAMDLFHKHVVFPTSDDDIYKSISAFEYLGFPGCIGSMDVVHVHWDMCPMSLQILCRGKEGYPSLAYQVIVDHLGRALSCTAGFYGSFNDKTIVKFDGAITKLRQGSHKRVTYKLKGRNGKEFTRRGVWVMVDGGYIKWEVTMAACGINPDPRFVAWRKKIESVRKDVECFFGRLKKRFRILKLPIQLHKKLAIDNVFFACVTIQNMLHEWDGLGGWSNGVDLEGEIEGSDIGYWGPISDTDHFSVWKRTSIFSENVMFVDCAHDASLPTVNEIDRYTQLQTDLVEHFGQLMLQNQHNTWIRS